MEIDLGSVQPVSGVKSDSRLPYTAVFSRDGVVYAPLDASPSDASALAVVAAPAPDHEGHGPDEMTSHGAEALPGRGRSP